MLNFHLAVLISLVEYILGNDCIVTQFMASFICLCVFSPTHSAVLNSTNRVEWCKNMFDFKTFLFNYQALIWIRDNAVAQPQIIETIQTKNLSQPYRLLKINENKTLPLSYLGGYMISQKEIKLFFICCLCSF